MKAETNDFLVSSRELEIRKVYEALHELLDEGLKKNGFTREFEAISFVSSLYSHVMHQSFIQKYISILRNNFHSREQETFVSDVRILLTNMTSEVTTDAISLGVSTAFVSKFFTIENTKATSSFTKAITSKDLSFFKGEQEYLASCLVDLYEFMSACLVSAKNTDYSNTLKISSLGDLEMPLIFIMVALSCFLAIILL